MRFEGSCCSLLLCTGCLIFSCAQLIVLWNSQHISVQYQVIYHLRSGVVEDKPHRVLVGSSGTSHGLHGRCVPGASGSAEKGCWTCCAVRGNYFSLPEEKSSPSSITGLWHF